MGRVDVLSSSSFIQCIIESSFTKMLMQSSNFQSFYHIKLIFIAKKEKKKRKNLNLMTWSMSSDRYVLYRSSNHSICACIDENIASMDMYARTIFIKEERKIIC